MHLYFYFQRYESPQEKAISSRSENKRFVGEEYQITILVMIATQAGAFGEIVCEVKTNNVTSISDGQPKIFTGFKDKFEVGDNIELVILYDELS